MQPQQNRDQWWGKDGRAWWCHCATHAELGAAASERLRQMSSRSDGLLYLKLLRRGERDLSQDVEFNW